MNAYFRNKILNHFLRQKAEFSRQKCFLPNPDKIILDFSPILLSDTMYWLENRQILPSNFVGKSCSRFVLPEVTKIDLC